MNDHTTETPREGQTRRSFLAKTAALGTAALLTTGAAGRADTKKKDIPKAGPRPSLGDGETIRMGIIGVGGMGSAHAQAFMSIAEQGKEKVQIVALSDVNDYKLDQVSPTIKARHEEEGRPPAKSNKQACEDRQGNTVDTYRNYHDLLARDDIHGVLIAAPEHWHGTMARDAIAAGKDVYVEKPMTLRLDDALHLREVVLANPQTIFQVGTQYMMYPKYHEAKKLIAEGGIGKPVSSQTGYCRNSLHGEWLYYFVDPAWKPGVNLDWEAWCGPVGTARWDPEVYARWRRYRKWSTGIIGDLLVHQMTPLMMALDMGWPTRVVASGGHYVDKAMENHDQVNINIEFEGEHTMVIAGSTCNSTAPEPMIRGREANLYLSSRHVELRPEATFAEDIDPRTIQCPDIGDPQDQLRLNWLSCIRSRKPAVSGIDLASKMMVTVHLATRSLWEGGAFEFDPATLTTSHI
ncbi:MAG: Gfo/Idh/MocA family oxidoreductase [Phycisphaerales bacterium]|nr:MAG: Gfo/Idh/MocA family oxidoreductase [Phycisphaerales bacterium]